MVGNTDDIFYHLKFLLPKLRSAPLKHFRQWDSQLVSWKLTEQISQLQTLNLLLNIFSSHLLEAQDKLFNWLNMSSQHRPQRLRIRTLQRFYSRTNPVTVGLCVGLQGGFFLHRLLRQNKMKRNNFLPPTNWSKDYLDFKVVEQVVSVCCCCCWVCVGHTHKDFLSLSEHLLEINCSFLDSDLFCHVPELRPNLTCF